MTDKTRQSTGVPEVCKDCIQKTHTICQWVKLTAPGCVCLCHQGKKAIRHHYTMTTVECAEIWHCGECDQLFGVNTDTKDPYVCEYCGNRTQANTAPDTSSRPLSQLEAYPDQSLAPPCGDA